MEKFKNKEAYKLMRYYCESCKQTEYIWNSGDTEVPQVIHCKEGCGATSRRIPTHRGKNPELQLPELTPLGIRWFITETKELYSTRIKKQIEEMADALFLDTTREIVERSLIEAYVPTAVRIVDPLTLNFEEQIQILTSNS